MTDTSHRVPERRIEQILSRAIEIDESYRRQVSVAEILDVAAEIGISREAVERAISEAEKPEAVPGDVKTPPSWHLPVAATAYGFVFGAAASTLFASRIVGDTGDWLVAGAFAVLQISGVALAASIDPDHRHYQRCNFGLYFGAAGGIAVGASVAHLTQTVPLDFVLNTLVGWVARGWLLSAIIGSGALLARSARSAGSGNPDSQGPTTSVLALLKDRAASTLRRIADRLSAPQLRLADLLRDKQPAA